MPALEQRYPRFPRSNSTERVPRRKCLNIHVRYERTPPGESFFFPGERPNKALCSRLESDRENKVYLADVALPRELRVEPMSAGLARADYVFLGVPSRGTAEVIANLKRHGIPARTPVISINQIASSAAPSCR